MLVSIAAVVSGVDAGVTLLANPVSVFTADVIDKGFGRRLRGPVAFPLIAQLVIDPQGEGRLRDQVFHVADEVVISRIISPGAAATIPARS
ncbi:Uncharacterised protein [Klebsiella pneumoniae]|uniref:Uncharacterized protein n=1 Tax=Klebsiella pneumoniae TaxID=573 RepID=A0AB74GSZ1_KLEPN|nr:Uncharacterised protein [Klebsiella pneumoniae]